jgi:NAD(P)-dependent dehydrogenase (short-subunit alcohol dehydrogenase family)
MDSKPLRDRIALVTGASRGLGRATALALAEAGAHVVAVARTVGALEELDDDIRKAGGSATLVPLDVKDGDGIDRLALALHERYACLDILIGNAGILGPLSPLSHVEPKAWDDVLAVNVTANWRLIRAFDALLRLSDAGRVVLVTSGAGSNVRAYWGPYATSKAAVDVLARTYAAETVTTAVRVNLFSPGPVRTRMRATALPGEDPETVPTSTDVARKIIPLCLPSFTKTGQYFDCRAGAFLDFTPPTNGGASVGESAAATSR